MSPPDTRFAVAVHILVLLDSYRGRLVKSDVIARSVVTNPARIRQILALLQHEKMTASHPGRRGGAYLQRPLREITLRNVYNAVYDEPLPLPIHFAQNHRCPVSDRIGLVLLGVFREAEMAMEMALDEVTVAQIAHMVHTTPRSRRSRATGDNTGGTKPTTQQR